MTTADRLTMSLGEAMFTQRAIRRLKPDPIPDDVMRDIMEAAIRAPNGGNNQQWHFIVVKDADTRKHLGELYHEAWWAKRKDQGIMGPEDIPPGKNSMRSAMRLANEFGDAPVSSCVRIACKLQNGRGPSTCDNHQKYFTCLSVLPPWPLQLSRLLPRLRRMEKTRISPVHRLAKKSRRSR